MIEKIRSLKDQGFEIVLKNPVSKSIYEVDSVNLIIGDNGSGKTRLIKSILRDLASEGPPDEFIVSEVPDCLGLIYYTGAPFHRPMDGPMAKSEVYLDVSLADAPSQRFETIAREYLEVTKELDITSSLNSRRQFDFETAALKIARSVCRPRPQPSAQPELPEYSAYAATGRRYRTAERKKEELQRTLRQMDRNGSADTELGQEAQTLRDKITELNQKLAWLAEERLVQEEALVDKILFHSGPRNLAQALVWIAFCCIPDAPQFQPVEYAIAQKIFFCDFDTITDASSSNWRGLIQTVSQFATQLKKTGSGKVLWGRAAALIEVDTAKLLDASIDSDLVQEAHRLGLIQLGLDRKSSGEAAILHQLISISHGIQTLCHAGKRNFLVFIDEGDMLLHLAWQRRYIDLIDARLGHLKRSLELESLQVVIATHSPLLATDVLRNAVTRLKAPGAVPAFGAPLQKIVNYSFKTPSIGLVAEKTIRKIRAKQMSDEEAKAVIAEIDDDFVRSYLSKENQT